MKEKDESHKIWKFLNMIFSIEFALFLFVASLSIFLGGEIYGIIFFGWFVEKLPNLSMYCFMAFSIIAFIWFLRLIFDEISGGKQ